MVADQCPQIFHLFRSVTPIDQDKILIWNVEVQHDLPRDLALIGNIGMAQAFDAGTGADDFLGFAGRVHSSGEHDTIAAGAELFHAIESIGRPSA